MRHKKRTAKLGMKSQHRRATLANMVCSLIKHKRIRTTIAKAEVARRLADQMVTLGKDGTLHARRLATARLHARGPGAVSPEERKRWNENEDVVGILFEKIAPVFKDRQGGYTRIIRIGQRVGDAAEIAILEWTDAIVTEPAPAEAGKGEETKPTAEATEKPAKAAKKPAKKKAEKKTDAAAK